MEEQNFSLKGVNVHFTFEDEEITITVSSVDEFFDFTVDAYEMVGLRYEKGIGQKYSEVDFESPFEFLKTLQKVLGNRLSYQEVVEKYFPKKKEEISVYEKFFKILCSDCKKKILEEK